MHIKIQIASPAQIEFANLRPTMIMNAQCSYSKPSPLSPPLSLSLSAPRILISLWGTRKLGNFLVPHPRPSSVVAVHRPASSPATGSVNRARNVTQLSLSSLDARASEAVFPTCDPACIPSLALDLASAGLRVRRET